MKPSFYHPAPLTTAYADRCDDWHHAYPRPAFRRAEETCRLLTDWQLSCLDEQTETVTPLGPICLPFPPEAPLSGICKTLEDGEAWLYQTAFSLSETERTGRVLLHLPPTDQTCIVTLNKKVYEARVSFPCPVVYDITDFVKTTDNALTVLVRDPLDKDIPFGKQAKKRGGMWYTPTSGMRGMLWLEFVPEQYIEDLHITPTCGSVTITVIGCETLPKTITYETDAAPVTTQFSDNCVTLNISNPRIWSPDDPYVYRFTIVCGEDTVSSYFALREISVRTVGGHAVLCLNGQPHYFHGLLDQGYDPDGIDLPASPDGYLRDIEAAKSLGFDTLRKHIRLEDPYFYYHCDHSGMLVFQDFINNGTYSFLRDTALPTVGLRRGIKHHASARQKQLFTDVADRLVRCLYNHPSVVYYTIFNEGWGQFDADALFRRYRKMDPTRIWDATSGWFFERESDVQSEHVYFRRLNLRQKHPDTRPLVLSEFGGYTCRIEEHIMNTEKSYGYKTMSSPAQLTASLQTLYRNEVLPMLGRGLCATIYTQLTDVEDEINGLYTYDRRVCKVDADVMRAVADDLRAEFARVWQEV